MNKQDDIFLSRWINNELSAEELSAFKASEDYSIYLKIIQASNTLIAPEYDTDSAYTTIKAAYNQQKKSSKRSYLSIAASVILLIGLISYTTFFTSTSFTSGYGEMQTITLPDGSLVTLNSKSTLSFNTYNWDKNRKLSLKGEAFFDVQKGSTFTVNTPQGNVTVLGTEFTIHTQPGYFNVVCYEGKVRIHDFSNNKTNILTPSLGYQNSDNQNAIELQYQGNKPAWINAQSVFKSTPIKHVFTALENQYNILIEYRDFDDTILFTGVFPNNNKEIALETVLKSVNLNYSTQENRIILED